MPDYSQENQPFRVYTDLDDDVLLPEVLQGTEGVSMPFAFTLDLVSETNDVDGEGLLRTPMKIEMDLPDGSTRWFHGIVRRFVQRGRSLDLVAYRAEIVPWLWFLSLEQDSRIFQGDSVPDIVEKVFEGQGYSDFEFRLGDDEADRYPAREYVVQYRESNLAFVSRLLEDAGIYYFFEHTEDKHLLVLTDEMAGLEECEGQPEARMDLEPAPDEDVVLELEREHSVHTGKITLTDYDYLKPTFSLTTTLEGDEPEEFYDYPGGFTEMDRAEHRAELALEREEARRHLVRGQSTCRAFFSGCTFELLDHYLSSADREYAVIELRHQARNAAYRGDESGVEFDYRNDFVAMPTDVPYRPPLRTPKPVVRGAHTAVVVGPSGEEVHVDEHGRVKVQFHWDRKGGGDENSSCWVRVSQNWAGKKWGGVFLPHIDHEVIVDFLEGDPDRPIITGRVYNEVNVPPLKLPDEKYISIIEDQFGHKFKFDATAGDEHIYIYAPVEETSMKFEAGFKFWTKGDWSRMVDGDEGNITKGMDLSGSIGFKAGFELGGSISLFGGFKLGITVAETITIAMGPSLKWSAGKEYKMGKQSFTQHTADQISIKSDTQAVVMGGKSNESILQADDKALVLQFGAGDTASPFDAEIKKKIAVGATTAAGLATTLGAAALWEGTENPHSFWLFSLAAPQFLWGAGTLGQEFGQDRGWFAKEAKKDRKGMHDKVHSQVKLDKTGAGLLAMKNKEADVKATVIVTNDGETLVHGDKSTAVQAESGNVDITSDNADVDIHAGAGIKIQGRAVIKIDGKLLKLG